MSLDLSIRGSRVAADICSGWSPTTAQAQAESVLGLPPFGGRVGREMPAGTAPSRPGGQPKARLSRVEVSEQLVGGAFFERHKAPAKSRCLNPRSGAHVALSVLGG